MRTGTEGIEMAIAPPATPTNKSTGTTVMGQSGIPTAEISKRYFMLSADNHINGPPDLFEKRVDKRFRHRLPRQEVDENGVKWSITEGLRPMKMNTNAPVSQGIALLRFLILIHWYVFSSLPVSLSSPFLFLTY